MVMRLLHWLSVLLLLPACLSALGCGSESGTQDVVPASIPGDARTDAQGGKSTAATAGAKAPERDRLHPVVEAVTSLGSFQVRLDAKAAPGTVANFLNYVNSGHYDGTCFHYVAGQDMVLGGGFTPDLKLKPGSAPIRNEAHNGLKNTRGTIAMSRAYEVIDSATSQFFVNLDDHPDFDHSGDAPETYGYCVFGEVVAGMDVIERISQAEVHDAGDFIATPVDPVVIESMRQVR
jgi:cyclophilin family peptidyl-prolyl cis-trans isomerase